MSYLIPTAAEMRKINLANSKTKQLRNKDKAKKWLNDKRIKSIVNMMGYAPKVLLVLKSRTGTARISSS